MQEILINFVFVVLRRFMSSEVIDKYEQLLHDLIKTELDRAPGLLKEGETLLVCKLKELASDDTNDLSNEAVALVAGALGVDLNACSSGKSSLKALKMASDSNIVEGDQIPVIKAGGAEDAANQAAAAAPAADTAAHDKPQTV